MSQVISRTYVADLFVPIDEDEAEIDVTARAAAAVAVSTADIASVTVVRRSLDARKGRPLGWQLRVEVDVGAARVRPPRRKPVAGSAKGVRVVVVGSGPCGTFAALWLGQAGGPLASV